MYLLRSLCATATLPCGLVFYMSFAGATEIQADSAALNLRDYQSPISEARWLQSQCCNEINLGSEKCRALSQNSADIEAEGEEDEVVVEGQTQPGSSSPVYTITGDEIQKQGVESLTEVLRNLPGFAVNDAGFGADIHTGFYYRGTTLNQNLFLLNGRSLNTNINTYHGATDFNNVLTSGIDRIELLSGTAATLYGSEAFGGIVNIITKDPTGQPFRANVLVQAGSYGQQNYRANISGSASALGYAIGYERFQADNDYFVPQAAANRGPDGRLFNGDVKFDNYFGRLTYQVDPRNILSLDTFKTTSRKGLLYFGFPLQRDRLDHDGLNIGFSWRSLIGSGDDSILTMNLGYNRDYFNTYGPTQTIFYRQGTVDSTGLTARIEHNWQVSPSYNLRYGIDVKGELFTGETLSTVPRLIQLNQVEDRDRTNIALFALNTFNILDNLQVEFGLRQNFNTEVGNSADPSVGLRWDLTPNLAWRGSWVSVRRLPGLDQLYLFDTVHNWLPNPDLKQEVGSAWTTGIDFQLNSDVTAQLTYFGNRLENRLAVVAGRWENIGLVDTHGFEATVRWKITPQVSVLANYTYTDARIKTGTDRGLQLSTIPFSVAQIGLGYDWNGWQVNLYANYHSGSRRALFTAVGDNPRDFSPSWLNLDLNARIPILQNVGLLIYLENLADASYEKVNRIYQPGLTFRVGLSATF
ncbi:MAG: TonB-dependent receptor [Pantanalinema sp. GBBB05]|nr:TonB-dependent receptor [Pantanalinema sp. GBBB05]